MKQFRIYLKGQDKTDDVRDYRRIGDKYEVIFNNGKTFNYNVKNVKVIEPRECFSYFKRIADEVGLEVKVEGDRTINILSLNYSKIERSLPPEDSVFSSIISGNHLVSKKSLGNQDTVIYPFGFNVSQKSAVERSLTNTLSIIEGPPGTGKTQTILNIIANAVMRGGSVAVVSSNNSATKNVYEKLQKNGVEFIAAYLGNTDNKTNFIADQKPVPDLKNWTLSSDEIKKLLQQLQQSHELLQKRLIQLEELASLKQQLSEVETEKKHFLSYSIEEIPREFQKIRKSQEALKLWLLCESERFVQKNKILALFERILSFLLFNRKELLIEKMLKTYPLESLITIFQGRFYELKQSELAQSVAELSHQLESFDFNAKMKEYSENSMKVFRSSLGGRYSLQERPIYEIADLREESESFIKDYPVILSTTYSLRSSLSNDVVYDYVIIDESSQVDLCTGILALSCARNAVIVGDLKQLPHVVDSEMAKATDEIFSDFNLPETYRYKNQSLLSSLITMFPDSPKTLLREHYRCHPKIIEFCNKKFYGGQLVILTEPRTNREPLIVYKTVVGNHARNRMNQRQIDIIINEIIPEQGLSTSDGSLGIITPYRNQTNALQRAFEEFNVKADTVDKFQGQENAVVILSTVDNEVTEFSDNANRLNVAVSRAIDQLIVVVSDEDTKSDTNIGDLIRYIQYNNFQIVESKIRSVFDYLYASYSYERRKLLAKSKKISRYDSENLMYAKIETVLRENDLTHFKIATHVPLRMIIQESNLLNTDELKYAMNVNTHVDFLIYDNVSKIPKLIVEVDGIQFHQEGSKQAKRDLMKNEILKKYDLPLLRLKTDGSGEDRLLLQALK
jgi:superfamily I DNA and/or RNA helicase